MAKYDQGYCKIYETMPYLSLTKVCNKTKEPMQITPTPNRPFDTIIVDTLGPLQKSVHGFLYVLKLICDMSKYLISIPMRTKTAREVAKAIFEQCILVYGPMKQLLSDMGTEFNNELVSEICQMMNIERKVSTAYHHQTVGTIERSHREFNKYFRIYLNENGENWDTFCHYFTFCHNISKSEASGNRFSPFELVFSKSPVLPSELFNGDVAPCYNVENYAKESKYRLQKAYKLTREIIGKLKLRNKKYYDKTVNPLDINVDDFVLMDVEPYNKLNNLRRGPFKVIDIDYPNATIQLENKQYKLHINRLKKANL